MIKINDKELEMEQKEAEKTAAYDKIDTVYTLGVMKFKVKEMTGKAWRLVYDGPNVITLINGTDQDITTTIHVVIEYEKETQALEAIEKLGLISENESPAIEKLGLISIK